MLERGAVPPRIQEIGPSLDDDSPSALVIRTDINGDRAALDKVTVQAVAAGGKILAEAAAARGESVRFDPRTWPDGAYEIRCATRRMNGLLYATHLPWYKGDSVAAARALVAAGGASDLRTPNGFTTKMLADLVTDRLGKDLAKVAGNPWWAIHSPLMEFEELRQEEAGKPARERPYGFVRLAWRDEIDGSPQFCRAYLPGGYDRKKKWPLVIHIHGYNPANPDYVRWWSVDQRHNVADVEYGAGEGVIYMEPHGRGNNNYLGLGDQDVVRAIRLAKERFSVDEERVYLVGDSMGGWGTWNVATRHPDLFAAIAPIYGGSDYHSQYSEEALAKLTPLDRFLAEKHESSWAMAEGLLHLPILVHHGDVDRSVNVDFSRYGVRLLERWGYNVRYVELPGYGHEELSVMTNVIDWFLQHRRVANPPRVRLRSAELENASAYWVRVEQAASPKEFMVVDAEITGPNTIRVDSQNVLALSLAPVIDASRPVRMVWNGELRTITADRGRLTLAAPGYEKAKGEKNAAIAGPIGEIFNTPFAIVTGTASADPAMKEMCRRKAEAAVNFWKQWQRQPPRVFLDSEISDADAARYSLLLIGAGEANLLARKLGSSRNRAGPRDHSGPLICRFRCARPGDLSQSTQSATVRADGRRQLRRRPVAVDTGSPARCRVRLRHRRRSRTGRNRTYLAVPDLGRCRMVRPSLADRRKPGFCRRLRNPLEERRATARSCHRSRDPGLLRRCLRDGSGLHSQSQSCRHAPGSAARRSTRGGTGANLRYRVLRPPGPGEDRLREGRRR